MNKYKVNAHVTIYVEREIEASSSDEADAKFTDLLDEEFGWADCDTTYIERIDDDEIL